MTDAALLALRETRAALGQLMEQVEQMRGMFSDSDGAIRNALADAEAALAMWHEFRASVDPNDQGCCATCGNSREAHGFAAPQPYMLDTGTEIGAVRIGGRWDGWLFRRHPDGQFVSVRKLNRVETEGGAA